MALGSRWNRIVRAAARVTHNERRGYALAACLALVVAVRLLTAPSVYENGAIVLSGNDPYAYLHAVEAMVDTGASSLSSPVSVGQGEPLLVTTLWAASLLLGGSQWATATVVAWYPVVSALVTALLVYAVAVRASDDPRVGLAAVLLLAVTPVHGFRTSLGFADHHAFDYVWVVLTAYALILVLTTKERRRFHPGPAVLLGVGVAGQLLAWNAGPLLLVPITVVLPVSAVALLDTDLTPLVSATVGIGVGAVLTSLVHFGIGWHGRTVVVVSMCLFAGSLGVLTLTCGCRRLGRSWPTLVVLGLSTAVAGWVALSVLSPAAFEELASGITRLFRDTRIGEMSSLIDEYGVVLGPLIMLGFAPFLAVPGLVIAIRDTARTRNLAWPVVAVYAGYFFVLAVIQRRFAGELAPFLAILGGLGTIGLLGWLDLVRRPAQLGDSDAKLDPEVAIPDRTRLALLGGMMGVFAGTGTLYTRLIDSRVTIDRNAVQAAQWMRGYADTREWRYPETFVLSEWGRNRMFNYFVNGQASSYGYAKRYYEDFLFTSDARTWYERFADQVGFIVVRNFDHIEANNPFLMYSRLLRFGSAGERAPGLGHYRAVYASPDEEFVVFTLVPGATVSGTVDGSTEISTTVSIPGTTFRYRRRVEPGDSGSFSVTVAQPGTYRLGERRVTVSEKAVETGRTVPIE